MIKWLIESMRVWFRLIKPTLPRARLRFINRYIHILSRRSNPTQREFASNKAFQPAHLHMMAHQDCPIFSSAFPLWAKIATLCRCSMLSQALFSSGRLELLTSRTICLQCGSFSTTIGHSTEVTLKSQTLRKDRLTAIFWANPMGLLKANRQFRA